jgi:hypothetical protein
MSSHDRRRHGRAGQTALDPGAAASPLAPGKRPLTGSIERASVEGGTTPSTAASASTAQNPAFLPIVGDAIAQLQTVTGQLLPGYRNAVDALHAESAAELGLATVEAYRHVIETRVQLAEDDPTSEVSAYEAEVAHLDAVLAPTEQALAWQLGPQTFHGRAVISGVHSTPLGRRAGRADQLAAEVLQVASLLSTARRVSSLVPNPGGHYSVPISPEVGGLVVALVEPWRSRPVNFAFLKAALSVEGTWHLVASLRGGRLDTLDQLDQAVRDQAQETGALGDVGDFDAARVAGLVLPHGFDQAGADEVFRMLTTAAPDALGGLVVQLAKTGRLEAVLGPEVRARAEVQALHDALPFDGRPSNKEARRDLRPIVEATIPSRIPLPGFGDFDAEPGGKSNTRRLDEGIESSDSAIGRGGLHVLRFLYHGASFGFAAEHDAAYDNLNAGATTVGDFESTRNSALAKAGIVGAVSSLTGGALGAYGAGLGGRLVGPRTAAMVEGAFAGLAGGLSGAMTADAFDVATGTRDASDVSGWDWLRAGGYGAAIGAGLSGSAVLSGEAARHIPGGRTRAQDLAMRHPRHAPLFDRMRLLGERDAIAIRATLREIREWIDAGILPPGGAAPALALAGGFGDDAALLVTIEASTPMNVPGPVEGPGITIVDAELDASPMQMSWKETSPGRGAVGSHLEASTSAEVRRGVGGRDGDPAAWVDELRSRLSPEELITFEKMGSRLGPAKIRDQYGGDLDAALRSVRNATSRGRGSADLGRASQARADELRVAIQRRGMMKHPEVVAVLDDLGPDPLPREVETAVLDIRSRLMSEILESETAAAYPTAQVLRDVEVWVEQDVAGRGARIMETPSGPRPHLTATDIDVLVVERPADGGKARIVHREEIKTGRNDQPTKAKGQLETGANAISTAARGGRPIRLVAGGVDITDGIDMSTVDASTAATRGPAGKGFDRSLGITADDLLRLVEDLVELERKSRGAGGDS